MKETHRTDAIEGEAAEWAVRLGSPDCDAATREAFNAWLQRDPRNQAEYARALALWRELHDLSRFADDPALATLDRPLLRERMIGWLRTRGSGRPLLSAAAALSLIGVLIAVVLLLMPSLLVREIEYATQTAEARVITLPDGSTVTLGPRSVLSAAFTRRERRVHLREGEAFFAVTKDPARPFMVRAGDTVTQVVGTQFNVHYGANVVRVSVLEGVVHVGRTDAAAAGAGSPTVLSAGQTVTARHGMRTGVAQHGELDRVGAWRTGRLLYDDAPLAEVIFDANRYFDGEIVLATPALADIGVTTSFRTGQVDELIHTLESMLPIDVEYLSGNRILLKPAKDMR